VWNFLGRYNRYVPLMSVGRTCGSCSRFADWKLSQDFAEVGLLIFGFQRTSSSSDFLVNLCQLGGLVLPSEFDNFTEQKILCLKCMDDLSQILLFPLL
jgi:hypothetical protein